MNRNLQEGATGSLTYTWEKVAVLYFHKYMLQIVTNICILFLLMDLRCELVKMADVIWLKKCRKQQPVKCKILEVEYPVHLRFECIFSKTDRKIADYIES